MNYIFRPSSSPKYGGGHVSRCLSLAAILKEDANVSFVFDDDGQYWFDSIKNAGYSCDFIKNIDLKKISYETCILDGYHFSNKELSLWRSASNKIVVIDDLFRSHKYADMIVNLSLPDELNELDGVPLYTKLKYAILNNAYNKKNKIKTINKTANNILVIFGYIDSNGATLNTLKVLGQLFEAHDNLKVKIIIGSDCPTIDAIKNIVSENVFKYELIINSNKVIKHLLEADLVIGSGGVGLLERTSLGIPSITISTSENQEGQVKKIIDKGGSISLPFEKIKQGDLLNTIGNTICDYGLREHMSINGRKTIDGLGAKRVSELIRAL